jgi:tetratricopeptide (TPR) repeat protein
MQNLLLLTFIFVLCERSCFANPRVSDFTTGRVAMDEEYDRYKKRGDDFFVQGDYSNALKQYRNCLEVPNFDNDPYAKGRIALVTKLTKLRDDATKLLNEGKGEEAVGLLKQILDENPNDPVTKVTLTDYWSDEATKLYAQKNYIEAKKRYQEALKYAAKSDLIRVQIQNCDEFIKAQQKSETQAPVVQEKAKVETPVPVQNPVTTTKPTQDKKDVAVEPKKERVKKEITPPITLRQTPAPKRRIIPKILTAVIGLGAGGYAYLLNNQYQTKLNNLNSVSQTTDPDGDNVILTQSAFNQWEISYKDVKSFQSNKTTMNACLGVAGAAVVAEIILFALPKPKKQTGFHFYPTTKNVGLALQYRF